jgi:hypothetical protein
VQTDRAHIKSKSEIMAGPRQHCTRVKSTLKIKLANPNLGKTYLNQFSQEAQIWWPIFANWLVSLCMSSLSQNPVDSFAAEGGGDGRTQHQFLGTRNIFKKKDRASIMY